MSYKIKNGKAGRAGKGRTTVTIFKRPVDLPVYQESDAEKAARLGDVVQFEKRAYTDGVVVYCVPGLEPDCSRTLEEAGLIKHYGSRTEVYEPHNPRVIAWQLSVNRWDASKGRPPTFPGMAVPIEAPTDTAQ